MSRLNRACPCCWRYGDKRSDDPPRPAKSRRVSKLKLQQKGVDLDRLTSKDLMAE